MNDDRLRAMEILDAQEGTGPVPLLAGDEPARLLSRAKRIAMVGASANEARPSHGVMRQLLGWGYEVVPVNPNGTEILGQRVFATLEDATAATGHFDIVDVFRRPGSPGGSSSIRGPGRPHDPRPR